MQILKLVSKTTRLQWVQILICEMQKSFHSEGTLDADWIFRYKAWDYLYQES